MNNFLGTADKKKLKHIKQFEIEIDFNHMHTNIFGKSFSHDLMKEKSVHRKSMPRLTSWFKAREKKVQQQNKERKRERENFLWYIHYPLIFFLIFSVGREKLPKMNGKSELFIQKSWWRITRYTICNLAIKLVNMFVNLKFAQTIYTCMWSVCLRAWVCGVH